MSGFQIKLTNAGRAALVNANNTGTVALTVSRVGVTATAFTPSAEMTSLPGEIKQLTTLAGMAVADDTIHVSIRDESVSAYSMRGFGLYLSDGTLFATYGQPTIILEKSAQSTLLLAADVVFADISVSSLTFGDALFSNPPASTTAQGITQYATNEEAETGAAGNRTIVAAALKYVLDRRFGAGAPSAFVKGLLSLGTAALVRTALELGSAATRGASEFAAAVHTHGMGSIEGLQAALEGKQPAGSYAAAAHSHAAGDIVSGTFAPARISQGSVTQHQAALSIDWTQIYNAGQLGAWRTIDPGTKLTHSVVSDWVSAFAESVVTWITGQSHPFRWTAPSDFTFIYSPKSDAATLGIAFATSFTDQNRFWMRGRHDSGGAEAWSRWKPWVELFHSGNFDPATKATLDAAVRFDSVTASGNHFYGGLGYAVLSPQGAGGTVLLRPDGASSQLGELQVGVGGVWWTGNQLWHAGNFSPDTKASLSGANFTGVVSAPTFARNSSRRYKRRIRTIDPQRALELLRGVRFVDYVLRADGTRAAGVVAEELAGGPLDFAVKRDADGRPDAVDYEPLFVLAATALQGLAADVAKLKAARRG